MNRREFLLATVAAGVASQIGCGAADNAPLLPARTSPDIDTSKLTLLTRFAQISDTHVVDSLSPARFCGGQFVTRSAWRPWEAYSGQIADGIVRTINRIHASGRSIDFVLHTGDNCDNAQGNELAWLLSIMDGRPVNPLSGPDDRAADQRPATIDDPYAAFMPQGLYRRGIHGSSPSIPWYGFIGNHDNNSIGVFAFFDGSGGGRTAPLPLQPRPGLVLPVVLDPEASVAYGNVTPAEPGPPGLFEPPRYIAPNPDRRFCVKQDIKKAFFTTQTGPSGHGLTAPDAPTWYSFSPAPGLRVIALDSTDPPLKVPVLLYVEAAMSSAQVDFLRAELDAAKARDEIVIVATHHPSDSLQMLLGSAISPDAFRAMLAEHSNVLVHLCGHTHRNRVTDRGSYLEIETCATIDLPQEGRLLEVYRDPRDGRATLVYEMFSHLNDKLPPLGEDPLLNLRATAMSIAQADAGTKTGISRRKMFEGDEVGEPLEGDRFGAWIQPA